MKNLPDKERILALDLGGTLGYAYLFPDPVFGTLNLVVKAEGARSYGPAVRLKAWLEFTIPALGVRHIAFEETFALGAAQKRMKSLQTVAVVYCMEHGLSWSRVAVMTLKKYATGYGHCGKDQMAEAALRMFPNCLQGKRSHLLEDEADALCVLAWAMGRPAAEPRKKS